MPMKAYDTLWGYFARDQWLAESTGLHRTSWDSLFSLRNGFTAYCALTPGYRAFLPPSPCGIWHVSPVGFFMPPQNLTPTSEASGPHAFAVRFGIVRPARRCPLTEKPPCEHTSRPTPSRPPHPVPTFGDDGQRPFPRGQDGVIRKGDLPDVESGILPDGLICRRQDGPQPTGGALRRPVGASLRPSCE